MNNLTKILIAGMVIGLVLSGCSDANPVPPNTAEVPSPTAPVVVEDPTATPALPVIVLLAAPESDPAVRAEMDTLLAGLAQENSYRYEQRQTLSAVDAPERLHLVIALPPVSELEGLARALPGVTFVAVNMPEVRNSTNLISTAQQASTDYQAFMAGYIAAVESDDWRVGLVYPGDAAGQQYRNAFLAGAIYYCGFCNPFYPPFYEYPLYAEVPAGAGFESYQQAVDTLSSQGVNTIHLAPGAQQEDLLRYAANLNLRFVGTSAPPAGLEGSWIASVVMGGSVDLRTVITQALSGNVGVQGGGSLEIQFTGLSEARLAHFTEIIGLLESGTIDPQGTQIE